MGKNKLGSYVSEMCTEAGISRKTNHSLRATGATSLFQSEVPEKIIQKNTGHRSLEALRKYERTSIEQHQAVSKVMMSAKKVKYDEKLQENQVQTRLVEKNPLDAVQKVFGDLTNCSIGNITVNIAPTFTTQTRIDSEFDSLVSKIELNIP